MHCVWGASCEVQSARLHFPVLGRSLVSSSRHGVKFKKASVAFNLWHKSKLPLRLPKRQKLKTAPDVGPEQ